MFTKKDLKSIESLLRKVDEIIDNTKNKNQPAITRLCHIRQELSSVKHGMNNENKLQETK